MEAIYFATIKLYHNLYRYGGGDGNKGGNKVVPLPPYRDIEIILVEQHDFVKQKY